MQIKPGTKLAKVLDFARICEQEDSRPTAKEISVELDFTTRYVRSCLRKLAKAELIDIKRFPLERQPQPKQPRQRMVFRPTRMTPELLALLLAGPEKPVPQYGDADRQAVRQYIYEWQNGINPVEQSIRRRGHIVPGVTEDDEED